MSTTTVWESGLTCDAEDCGGEFTLGEEIMYWYGQKLHQRCASAAAASRREAAGEAEDVLDVARRLLETRARVILTRRQLRNLLTVVAAYDPSFVPVRRPDAGTGRQQWYGRLAGWSTKRVAAGLNAQEVAGLWLDFLDAGRMPPLKTADLTAIMVVIETAVIPALSGAQSLPPRDPSFFLNRDLTAEGTGTETEDGR